MSGLGRPLLLGLSALLFSVADAAASLSGSQALPGGPAKVTGRLVASPASAGESLDFVFMRNGESAPITRYDVELTKQLHVIAVSSDLKNFVHDHVERVAKDGHFRLAMRFPKPGLYHVYADAEPSGIGQQVLRFDLTVGPKQPSHEAALQPSGLTGKDGPYSVRFDALDLAAGQESMLTMHIDKGGKPAGDLHPFLGVAAHAVLIRRDDLAYVHVHAMASGTMPSDTTASGAMAGMQDMPGMSGMTPQATSRVDPTLMIHVAPPEPGLYALWIQFIGGTAVRTVPFVLSVK